VTGHELRCDENECFSGEAELICAQQAAILEEDETGMD
jgi:hypothetical protein